MNQYVNNFSTPPLSLVYGFKNPEDQTSYLNKLFSDCLESHAPTRRVKLTRPITPWMKDPTIVSDRRKLELSSIKSRDSKYMEDKKQCKKTIKDKKLHFFVKRCHHKIPKRYGILLIVYSISNRKKNHEPSEMNNYFSNLAENLTNKENTKSNLTSLLNNLPD